VHLRGIHEHFARHLDPAEVEVLTAALSKVVAAARASAGPDPDLLVASPATRET
jgi:hypothetical protein